MLMRILSAALLLPLTAALANPMPFMILSEFGREEDGGWIEICLWGLETQGFENLDDCGLSCEAGTASFSPGLEIVEDFYVLQPQDLLEELDIDWSGDGIRLLHFTPQDTLVIEDCAFGEGCDVLAPLPGQSLASDHATYWYMDGSPTPGELNDQAGTMGAVEGYVTDNLGFATPGYEVIYEPAGWGIEFMVLTDFLGYYSFESRTRRHEIWAEDPQSGVETPRQTLYLEPDSLHRLDFVQGTVGVEEGLSATPAGRALLANHPNPFNPRTSIRWRLPQGLTARAVLRVFNLLGEEVRTFAIPAGRGDGELRWDGRDVLGREAPGGIYLVLLECDGQRLASGRMLLLR